MAITVLAVNETKKSELWDMLSAYLRELSQYGDVDLDYRFFESYWLDGDRWPYFIVKGGRTAGFELINTWSPSGNGTDFAVAEFCVLPEFRGAGAGKQAFANLLRTHSGVWEVSVMSKNEPGQAFWERTLESAGVSAVERLVLDRELVYRFSCKP